MYSSVAWRCAAALVLWCAPAAGDTLVLDLPTTIARAAQAPSVAAARLRVDEFVADRVTTTARNPRLGVTAGPRYGDTRTTDISVVFEQPVPLGRPGRARDTLSVAQIDRARVQTTAAIRAAEKEAALAYFDAVHAEQLVVAATHATELAQRAMQTAVKRRGAGDITDLDVDLAKAAVGRARSQVGAAESERAAAVGTLAKVLGLGAETQVTVRGDLRADARPLVLEELAARNVRPDVLATQRGRAVAEAEVGVARAEGATDLGVWFSYQREDHEDIFLAGLTFALPVWQRAQGQRALARARVASADAEIARAKTQAGRELVDAFAAYVKAREAASAFEADVLPALDDAELLLGKSLDAGQLSVADFLVARKELLDGRREYLDRLAAHAKARITAIYAAGAQ